MKLLLPVMCTLVLTHGYHLNSTRDETISNQLWQNFGKSVGISQLNAEIFAKSIFSHFKCLNCTNCAQLERTNLLEKMKPIVLNRDNLIDTTNEILFTVLLYGNECNVSANRRKWLPCATAVCIDAFLASELFSFERPLYHDEDAVEKGLKRLKEIGYTPRSHDQCFTRSDLFKDFAETEENRLVRSDVKFLVTALTLRLSEGDCISVRSELDFLTDVFDKYGTGGPNVIKLEGLEQLMNDLGIERDHEHNHEHNHDHDHDHDHTHEHNHDHDHDHEHNHDHDHDHDHNQSTTPNSGMKYVDTTAHIELMHFREDHSHDHDHDHDHDHMGDSGMKYETEKIELMHFSQDEPQETNQSLGMRTKRSLHDHPSKNNTGECWSHEDLFHKFDSDDSNGLNRDEFLHLCPALIQQKIRGKCDDIKQAIRQELNMAEVYGYGTLTVFIISLCSLLGIVLMPIKHSHLYQYVMLCLIALAFGTLTGDAMMHLIPEAVGLHVHDSNDDHGHDHGHGGGEIELEPYFWKLVAVLGAIYGLFVVESVSHMAMDEVDEKDGGMTGHNHSHIPNVDLVRMATKKDEDKSISTETLNTRLGSVATLNVDPERNFQSSELQTIKPKNKCWGLTTLALVIIIGDGIHNIADGLTIGAAFSSSTKGGISSALAIFFHELPHEFGDFVILLSTGLSYKKALIWNFLSSLTAFIGLYVGIELGENTVARQWILAIAAGMFLYIALGNMLPELKAQKCRNAALGFLAQNVGVLVGMSFMILIGIFEEKILI